MNQIIIHRVICYRNADDVQVELHGLRLIYVPGCWTASMGLIIDDTGDPYMPDEFNAFVNSNGVIVVSLKEWLTPYNETIEEMIDLWFDDEWHLSKWNRGHLYASIPDVLNMPLMSSIVNSIRQTHPPSQLLQDTPTDRP